MAKADVHGHRALLFINNPHVTGPYPDPTQIGPSYDVLTAPDPDGYSVPFNAKSIDDGDVAVVYRADAHSIKRDPGSIVAVARITSSPWSDRWGNKLVNWELQLLPPEAWVSSSDMKGSGLWTNRVPLSNNTQALSPVQLDVKQWVWLAAQFPSSALQWLEEHAQR